MRQLHSFWNKELPSFLSLLMVVITLGTISWLSGNIILFGSRAATGSTPKNVQISNISDTSFTISYITDEKVLGTASYGKDKTTKGVAMDDRDQLSGTPTPHRVHHVTIQQLTPSTTYFVAINSGEQTYMDKSEPYQITTAPPPVDKPTAQAPLAGKVILEGGSIPTEAIAYVRTSSSQLLSTVLKPDGSYLIPLNSMRQNDFSSYIKFLPQTVLTIQIVSPTLQSTISTIAEQANPVPLITLSQNYDFSLNDKFSAFSASDSAEPNASDSAQPDASDSAVASPSATEGLPQEVDTTTVSSPEITTPKETQVFKDQQPRFSGKAVPNTEVDITINSADTITATVTSDEFGNWSFRPDTPLAPGKHTITINSLDSAGIMQTITQSFTVYAAGSDFIEPSVPAAKPTVAPTVAQPTLPRPTSTTMPTATPIPSPTATPTINPLLLTPTASNNNGTGTNGNGNNNGSSTNGGNGSTNQSPTRPPIPKTGNEVVTYGIFASIISIIVGGILLSLL